MFKFNGGFIDGSDVIKSSKNNNNEKDVISKIILPNGMRPGPNPIIDTTLPLHKNILMNTVFNKTDAKTKRQITNRTKFALTTLDEIMDHAKNRFL